MPRLPNLTSRDELPDGLAETYDRVAELRGGQVSGPYGILIHSPDLALRAAQLSRYVRWESDLTPGQRETAIIACTSTFPRRTTSTSRRWRSSRACARSTIRTAPRSAIRGAGACR